MSYTHYAWPRPRHFHADLHRAFGALLSEDAAASETKASAWTPRVDIREDADRFLILADLPGVDPKSIEVNMDKGVLSISGERKADEIVGDGRYSRVERKQGAFNRRFTLPDSANPEGIVATGRHGVLEVSIPKRPETTPRRIEVQ
jgi:HSP20 family protein